MTPRWWWLLLLVVPLALTSCGGGEKAQTPEPSGTGLAAQPSATPYPPPTASPEPTEAAPTTTPEATPTPIEYLEGVFVVPADGSGPPVKLADGGGLAGWSPDGALIGMATPSPDQTGCDVGPVVVPEPTCFHDFSIITADGQGQSVSLADAEFPTWSTQGNRLLFYRNVRGPVTTSSGRTLMAIVAQELRVADITTGEATVLMSNGPIAKVVGETVSTVGSRIASARWSPDESRVLLGLGSGLYVAKADGSQPAARVAKGDIHESDWSPDGTRIVYAWGGEIYTVPADGSEPPRYFVIGHFPDWAPKGSRIAYIARTLPTSEIWLLDPATGEASKLVEGSRPVWSPDGSLLVYQAEGFLYALAPDGGGGSRKLAEGMWPIWSPDGKRIAFRRMLDRSSQLFTVNADGSGLTLVADNLVPTCVNWAWSPDSQRIAFSSEWCPVV